jgi:hypothetical protein
LADQEAPIFGLITLFVLARIETLTAFWAVLGYTTGDKVSVFRNITMRIGSLDGTPWLVRQVSLW